MVANDPKGVRGRYVAAEFDGGRDYVLDPGVTLSGKQINEQHREKLTQGYKMIDFQQHKLDYGMQNAN